jgi:hypothetical protein
VNCKKFRSEEQNKKREFVAKAYGHEEFAPPKFVPFNNGSLGDFKKWTSYKIGLGGWTRPKIKSGSLSSNLTFLGLNMDGH